MAERAEDVRRDLAALKLARSAPPPRRGKRRRVVIGAGVALAVVAAVAVWRARSRGVPHVDVVVAAAPLARDGGSATVPVLSGAGYVVSAARYISIGARVAGRIDHYLVEEGDHVQAGDALVQLDAREYDAAVKRAEAALAVAKTNADLKEKQRRRAEALAGEGIISRDELDLRLSDAAAAVATIGQAEAELASAKVALEYTTLRAPRSGVVLAKLKEVGEIAVPGGFSGSGDLVRIADLTDLRGQVDVTEGELAKVRMGQPAEVTPDAYPDHRYAAHVVKLYPQIDKQKGTLRVEVQIERPDQLLWPDMSARIVFLEPVDTAGGTAILVPRTAIRGPADAPFVWTVADEHVRRAPIVLGAEVGDQVAVKQGLAGGERVVAGDPGVLEDGQPVAVNAGR